jgi:uncharacterized protein (TIGR00369 family)
MTSNAWARPLLDVARIEALLDANFPQIHAGGRSLVIEAVGHHTARVRLKTQARNMRPGGTVSGPAMFTLADFAVYVAIIAAMGECGIAAVTTNMNINFLTKPEPRDMTAHVRLIRLGRRLAVGEAELMSDGAPDLVAHAIATYALPARTDGNIIPAAGSMIPRI